MPEWVPLRIKLAEARGNVAGVPPVVPKGYRKHKFTEQEGIAMYLISVFLKILPVRLLRRGTEVAVSGARATVRQPDLLVLTEESYAAVSTMSRSLPVS